MDRKTLTALEPFFHLLRCGLWNQQPDSSIDWAHADWDSVVRLAQEQGVPGVIADAVARLPLGQRPPRRTFMSLLLTVKEIEDSSDHALKIASRLQWYLHDKGCDTVILKGLGMARNYPNPAHRIVGDIDLLTGLSHQDFERGRKLLQAIASEEYDVNEERCHAAYTLKGQMVELHGSIVANTNSHTEDYSKTWAAREMAAEPVTWMSPEGPLHLPPYQFDALYVFIHFFRHFIGAACGLRQLCDWVMFIDRQGDKVDVARLKDDIEKMHFMRPWQIFASVAVRYFGIEKTKMLLYDGSGDKYCEAAVSAVIQSNHNLDRIRKMNESHRSKVPFLQHARSFFYLIPTYCINLRVFPRETIYAVRQYVWARLTGR